MSQKSGYVLLLTLLLLATSMVMVTRLVGIVVARYHQSALFVRQEKARQLAISGIQIILSHFNTPLQTDEKNKKVTEEQQQTYKAHIFEFLNQWKVIELEDHEGIKGTIKLYVSSEQGKINVNALYDFEKKQFIKQNQFDGRKIITFLSEQLKSIIPEINLSESLENFFKQRDTPLDDVTELVKIKELSFLNHRNFPEFSDKKEKEENVFLTDLFTIEGKMPLLQPTQLSASVSKLLGLSQAPQQPSEKDSMEFAKNIKAITNWAQEWNKLLVSQMGKEYTALAPEIRNLFSSEFESQAFSVISYGQIDTETQKLCAIIEKNTISQKDIFFVIKKIYWLS